MAIGVFSEYIYIYLNFFAPLPFNDSLVILVVDFKKKWRIPSVSKTLPT